ncbi:MAG: DUF5372 family protein [Anaerolineae bacterium]
MDGEVVFTVTHPFHPLSGQHFPLLARRESWGESRVLFQDPITGRVCSLPTAWTDLGPPDPFVLLADGRTVLRLHDLQSLLALLRRLNGGDQEGAP